MFPVIVSFMESYKSALTAMNFVALSFLMQVCSVGYAELLISRNREKLLALLSAGALLINFVLAICMVQLFEVSFDKVIIATMITYLLYSFVVSFGAHIILGKSTVIDCFFSVLPFKVMIPFVAGVVACAINKTMYLPLPLIVFIIFNYKDIRSIVVMTTQLVNRPQMVDL